MLGFLGVVVFSCRIHAGVVEIANAAPRGMKLCLCNPRHGPAVRGGRCYACNERKNAARRLGPARRSA